MTAPRGKPTVKPAPKPTPAELGVDPEAQAWERSGDDAGSIELAFPAGERWERGDWVLMRVTGDPSGRVLVFDRNEWECFVDGARKGEFDDACGGVTPLRSREISGLSWKP